MDKVLRWFAATCSLACFLGPLSAFPAAAQESVARQSEAANGQWPEAANSQSEEAAAQAQVGPSQQDQLEGELEIVHQDFEDGRGRYLYFLKVPDGTQVPLHFIKEPPTHVLTGDHVRVSGQLSGGSLILYSGSTNVKKTGGGTTTSSIPVPYTFGAQSTIIILVNFQDDAVEPYAVADAQNMFFGTGSTLNSFILENSYGQTSITGTVVGWYTIPVSVTTCDISQIATDAQNAATANGANLSNYTRYVYLFPYTSACAFAGASNVGGNPSQSWINGTLDSHVIDHELGHAFGLWHAHLLDCGATATICSNGTIVEYGDPMDVMGQPQTASPDYNAFQKERLGWLNYGASPSIQIVTTGGTYTIYPYEVGGSGPNALKILKSTDPTTGAKTWYYLEARQAIGFDAFLTNSIYYTQNETTGVLFHLGTDGNGNSSELLDMTPATPATTGWLDMSLAVGQTFQDARAGVTFTPAAVDSTGATVEITFGPAVSLAVSGSTFTSGQKVTYTANVLSGGAAAAGASVTFTITEANGSTTTNTATANSQGVATWSYKFGPSDPKGTWSAIAQASYNSQTATGNTTTFTVQ